MPITVTPPPNLTPQIAPMPDALQKAGQMVQLKTMLGQQQLLPLQMQEEQQRIQTEKTENEMKEMTLQGQRAMAEWFKDPGPEVAPKDFSQNDNVAAFLGIAPTDPLMGIARTMAKKNVPVPMVMQEIKGALDRREAFYKGTKEQQDAVKNDYDMWRTTLAPIVDEKDPLKRSVMLAEAMPTLQGATKATPMLAQLAGALDGHPEFIDHANTMVGAQQAALGIGKAKAEKAAAEQKVIPEGGVMSPEARQDIAKKAAEAGDPQILAAEIAKEKALAPVKAQAAAEAEISKEKALAPELQQIASTTRAGRTYINRDDIPKGSEGVIEQQAAAQGIRIVDKETAGTLTDIDEAKANMQSMMGIVEKKLAKNPGERIYKGPENKLEAAMQTDPDLAAMGTFRNAAIKTMRAVAGSKGLRINQYEVQLAIDNDIPKMTDTWEVAQSKTRMLNTFLDNAEQAHMVKNRAAASGTAPKKEIHYKVVNGQLVAQ